MPNMIYRRQKETFKNIFNQPIIMFVQFEGVLKSIIQATFILLRIQCDILSIYWN